MALLLAILGRGIQRPSADSTEWDLTKDLEVCNEKGAHLPVRVPENDEDPNSLIGGGELNLLAGAALSEQLHPSLVVCAYGARSKYLNQIGAPSESEIMSDNLAAELTRRNGNAPPIEIFDEKEWGVEESGTNRELYNIFTLATRRNISTVAIVTVAVHLPRATLMAQRHLMHEPSFKGITLQCYASELILPRDERLRKIFGSKSYIRTLEREIKGMDDLLAETYQEIASVTN